MNQSRILELIGEIEGIDLETDHAGICKKVYIRILGKQVEVIQDCGELISHSVTRIGIVNTLERSKIK